MFKLILIFLIFIKTILLSFNSYADTCLNYLSIDNFRHSRVWQEFALTHPEEDTSLLAFEKLKNYYVSYNKARVDAFSHTRNLSPKIQKQLERNLNLYVLTLLIERRDFLYNRFEYIKKFRELNTPFYQQEVQVLRETIDQTTQWLKLKIEEFLVSST